jgi:AraC-like DNA-binding protein
MSAEIAMLKQAEKLVLNHLSDPAFSVPDLAKDLGYGERQLRRMIKKLTGLSPVSFILELRLQKAF